MKSIVVALMTVFMLGSASAARVGQKAQVGKPFSLRVGEKVAIEGTNMKVKFLSVGDDSRCPQGATCVWAGNAEVKLKIGKSRTATLNTGVDPREISVDSFKIKIAGLTPHPRQDTELDRSRYEVTLIVSRQ